MPDDHTRIVALEPRVDKIDEQLSYQTQKLDRLDDKVDKIGEDVAAQKAVMPILQEDVKTILNKMDTCFVETAKSSTKNKITWGILSALLTGTILTVLSFVLGG